MPKLGPWIREENDNAVDFLFGKQLLKGFGICQRATGIVKILVDHKLGGGDHALERNIQTYEAIVLVGSCHPAESCAFVAADFND